MSKKLNDIVIFSAGIAKDLLDAGYSIINIQPSKRNRDKTIFYFERTKEIEEYISVNHSINVR